MRLHCLFATSTLHADTDTVVAQTPPEGLSTCRHRVTRARHARRLDRAIKFMAPIKQSQTHTQLRHDNLPCVMQGLMIAHQEPQFHQFAGQTTLTWNPSASFTFCCETDESQARTIDVMQSACSHSHSHPTHHEFPTPCGAHDHACCPSQGTNHYQTAPLAGPWVQRCSCSH
jgi:hypothetical protein